MQLGKIIKLAFGVALISGAAVGTAQAATFTNYADFQAATTDLTTIDFEGITNGFNGSTFTNVNGATIAGVTFSAGFPPRFPSESDSRFVVLSTIGNDFNRGTGDILLTNSDAGFNATLPSETTAFGFDLLTYGRINAPAPYRITLSTGEFFDISSPTFFGFTSATPISSISIEARAINVVLDNFSFGQASNVTPEPVPEPASILGTLAFAALGGKKLLKRKQEKTV